MRSFVQWTAPLPDGGTSEETALVFDKSRGYRLLLLPALFDEANKLRHLTVEVMYRLDLSGIDCILPDLPGCNDSLAPLSAQTLAGWRAAAASAAEQFRATHLLTVRTGAMCAPDTLPGWRYAPQAGARQLRSMIRAQGISAKEAGDSFSAEEFGNGARENGADLAGWSINAEMFAALSDTPLPDSKQLIEIGQENLSGAGLWLRAEPDHDPEQADAIAAAIAVGLLQE